ncbi:MAG: heme exporter protein CcmB [Archaeoglobaceae archaeon]
MGDWSTMVKKSKKLSTLLGAVEVAKKDLNLELKNKTSISYMLLFAITSVFLFSIAGVKGESFIPALMLVLFFTNMLGMSMSFLREVDLETIEGLRASPLTIQQIIIGKTIFNLILAVVIFLVTYPLAYALFEVKGDFYLGFITFLTINIAMSIVVSSLSPLLAYSRIRELLFPVMLFPILFPTILTGVQFVNSALNGFIDQFKFYFIIFYVLALLLLSNLLAEYL